VKTLKDRLGPFSPDSTSVQAKRGGKILAIERVAGCDGVVAFYPVLGAVIERMRLDDQLRLLVPLPFFAGQALSMHFEPAPGFSTPYGAEAYLVVEYNDEPRT
jgi:hypothetical protein